jgi:hypothetical protein
MFYLNLTILTLITIYYIEKTIKSGSYVSLQMVTCVGILFFLFINPLLVYSPRIDDTNFNTVIFVGILGTWVACMIIPLNSIRKKERLIPAGSHPDIYKKYLVKSNVLNVATGIFIFYVLFATGKSIVNNGLNALLVGGRGNSSNYSAGIESSVDLLFVKFLQLFLLINVNRVYKNGEKVKAVLIFIFPILYLFVTAETRFDTLALIISFLIFTLEEKYRSNGWSQIRKPRIKKRKRLLSFKTLVILPVAASFSVWFMNIANLWRGGYVVRSSVEISFLDNLRNSFPSIGSYYDFFYDIYILVNVGQAKLEYGLSWFWYPIINYIPRFIWPAKPITSFPARYTSEFYSNHDAVYTFTLFGEGYAQLKVLGVFIVPLVLILSRYVILKPLERYKDTELFRILFIITLFTFIRSNAPVFDTVMYLLFIMLIKILFTEKIESRL